MKIVNTSLLEMKQMIVWCVEKECEIKWEKQKTKKQNKTPKHVMNFNYSLNDTSTENNEEEVKKKNKFYANLVFLMNFPNKAISALHWYRDYRNRIY